MVATYLSDASPAENASTTFLKGMARNGVLSLALEAIQLVGVWDEETQPSTSVSLLESRRRTSTTV